MIKILNEYKDILITIGIHILMPIVYFFIFLTAMAVPLVLFANEFANDIYNPFGINFKTLIFIVICIFYFTIFVLRVCILPYWYYLVEKKSQSNILKNFIYNLKNNIWYRLLMLIVVEIPILILVIYATYDTIPQYKDFLPLLFTGLITYDLLGCYFVLFIWWDIQKLIKKYKNKPQQCQNS